MAGHTNFDMKALGRDFKGREDISLLCAMAVEYARTRDMKKISRMGRFPETYVFKEEGVEGPEISGKPLVMIEMAFESVMYGQNIFGTNKGNYSGQRELEAIITVMAKAIENDYAPHIKKSFATRPLNVPAQAHECAGNCGCGGGCGSDCKCHL